MGGASDSERVIGVRVGVRDGFWTEGEASDSERVVKTLLLSTTRRC